MVPVCRGLVVAGVMLHGFVVFATALSVFYRHHRMKEAPATDTNQPAGT